MGGTKRMGRIYRARNGVTEEVRFTVSASAKPRQKKQQRSTPRKQEQNKNQAAHILGRILNNNFEQGDLFLTLEYKTAERKTLEQRARDRIRKEREEDGRCGQRPLRIRKQELEDAMLAEVDRDATLFLRRCRDAGLGKAVKHVIVPSDRDGKTGKQAAPHIHIVLSGEQFTLIEKQLTLCGRRLSDIWGKGLAEYEFLRGGPLNKLAAYLIRQTRQIPNRKKYRCSRTVEKIVPEEFEIAEGSGEIRIPRGAEIMERQENAESQYHMQYVRYSERKREIATSPSAPRNDRGGGKRGV